MGPCAGGAVYSPAITDFIFMVEGTSYMFVTGPDVIKTVTHEEVTKEELGGAATHAGKSGVSHFTVPNDAACLAVIRELLSFLPSNNLDDPPPGRTRRRPEPRGSAASTSSCRDDPNKPYDIKELIAAVVDDGKFFEVHAALRPQPGGRLRPPRRPAGRASSPTSPPTWPACSTSTPRSRARASCASATPSTSR